MTLAPPQWHSTHHQPLRPTAPTDYRSLMRQRRALPAKALNSALVAIFDDIDLYTLAVRGTHLARRAVADTAAAAELAAIAVVLADAVASPHAAHVTATIAALRTRIGHTHRNGFELLMFAYRDLLTDPSAHRAVVATTRTTADAQAPATAYLDGTHWNEVAAS